MSTKQQKVSKFIFSRTNICNIYVIVKAKTWKECLKNCKTIMIRPLMSKVQSSKGRRKTPQVYYFQNLLYLSSEFSFSYQSSFLKFPFANFIQQYSFKKACQNCLSNLSLCPNRKDKVTFRTSQQSSWSKSLPKFNESSSIITVNYSTFWLNLVISW